MDRSLDRLFENNPTSIFMQIAIKVADTFGIARKFLNLDTTTMSVHGEYKHEDIDQVPITITHGYSKDKRNDLKQFVISLIASSQSDFPVWMDVLSCNASDKTHFRDVIKKFSKELSESDGETYFVIDSAMYSEESVKEISPLAKWISSKLDNNEALKEYKGQPSVERGFRFLKYPLFFASSGFLKKPERIVSLGMIMVLSLLVYSGAQFKLRKALEENMETIPNQL